VALSRRETFWLIVLPCGLGVAAAVGAAVDLVGGSTSAAVWAGVAGLAGLVLVPALRAYAPQGGGERAWWFAPLLGVVIAVGSVASALGPSVEACLLAFFAGGLLSFAGLVMRLARRGKVGSEPRDRDSAGVQAR
jgi:hypothetical protein